MNNIHSELFTELSIVPADTVWVGVRLWSPCCLVWLTTQKQDPVWRSPRRAASVRYQLPHQHKEGTRTLEKKVVWEIKAVQKSVTGGTTPSQSPSPEMEVLQWKWTKCWQSCDSDVGRTSQFGESCNFSLSIQPSQHGALSIPSETIKDNTPFALLACR